jgi:hypothetical protein
MLSSARRLATTAAGRSQQKAGGFSTTTVAAPPPRRLVVSRRAWRAYKETLPKKVKKKVDKPEDKPWPRNMQLAAYGAAAIFVPYATIWFITSNPSLREALQGVLPLDKLRSHFGDEEWDVKSYVEREELNEECYKFPNEPPLLERQQEAKIQEFNDGKVSANIYLLSDDGSQEQMKEVPASTRANRKALLELVGTSDGKDVAVDFVDTYDSEMDSSSSSSEFGDTLSFPESADSVRPLLQTIHTYSSWHHVPSQQAQAASQLNVDLEVPRLEFVIDELEKSLKDPSCTRDIDGMVAELNEAKSDLRRLKWKRRLGW